MRISIQFLGSAVLLQITVALDSSRQKVRSSLSLLQRSTLKNKSMLLDYEALVPSTAAMGSAERGENQAGEHQYFYSEKTDDAITPFMTRHGEKRRFYTEARAEQLQFALVDAMGDDATQLLELGPDGDPKHVRDAFNDLSHPGVLISMESGGFDMNTTKDANGPPTVDGSGSLFRIDHATTQNQFVFWQLYPEFFANMSYPRSWGYVWLPGNQNVACAYPIDAQTHERYKGNNIYEKDRCGTYVGNNSSDEDTRFINNVPRYCCSGAVACSNAHTPLHLTGDCLLDMMIDPWLYTTHGNNSTWANRQLPNFPGSGFHNEVVLTQFVSSQTTLPKDESWPLSISKPNAVVWRICNDEHVSRIYPSLVSEAALRNRTQNVAGTAIEGTPALVIHLCPGDRVEEVSFLYYARSTRELQNEFDIECYKNAGINYYRACVGRVYKKFTGVLWLIGPLMAFWIGLPILLQDPAGRVAACASMFYFGIDNFLLEIGTTRSTDHAVEIYVISICIMTGPIALFQVVWGWATCPSFIPELANALKSYQLMVLTMSYVLCGMGGKIFSMVAFGIDPGNSGQYTAIICCDPILVALFFYTFYREVPSSKQLVGVMIVFVGLVIMSSNGEREQTVVFLCFLAASCYAGDVICSRICALEDVSIHVAMSMRFIGTFMGGLIWFLVRFHVLASQYHLGPWLLGPLLNAISQGLALYYMQQCFEAPLCATITNCVLFSMNSIVMTALLLAAFDYKPSTAAWLAMGIILVGLAIMIAATPTSDPSSEMDEVDSLSAEVSRSRQASEEFLHSRQVTRQISPEVSRSRQSSAANTAAAHPCAT